MNFRIFAFLLIIGFPFCYIFGNSPFLQDFKLDSLVKAGNQKNILLYLHEKTRQGKKLSPRWRHYYQNMRGKALYRLEKLEETLAAGKVSLELFKASKDSALLSDTWRIVAVAYNRLGKLDSSLVFTQLLYDYAKVNGDYQTRRGSMMLLGNIATQNKRYQQGYDFYAEALQESIKQNDPVNLPVDYYNLGLAHFSLRQLDQAKAMFNKSLALSQKNPDLRLLIRIYGSLSDIAEKTDNLRERKYYLQKSIEVAEKIADFRMLATSQTVLMRLSLKEKNYAEAISLGKKAKTYLQRAPFPMLEVQIDSLLFVVSKLQGNFQQALYYYETFSKKQREIINEKEVNKLNEISARFNLEKKNLLIATQKAEILASKRANRINLLVIALLLSLLLYIVLAYFRERKFRTSLYQVEKSADQQISVLRDKIENHSENATEPLKVIPTTASLLDQNQIKPAQDKSLALFNQIIETIIREKLFLNPELDQKFIVQRLGTNKAYLYDAISNHGDVNFKGLINRLRIDEAKTLIRSMVDENKVANPESVMYQSGFNSKSSFYRLFKTQTGLTPLEYAEEYKKDKLKKM